MRRRLIPFMAISVLFLAACGGSGGSSTQNQGSSGAAGDGQAVTTLRYATSSAPGFGDIPVIAAFDALREEEGINVELVPFQSGDLGIRALVSGQVDMAVAFPQGILSANREGANLAIFFNGKNNEWVLAARSDITEPEQLNGKRVARHSPTDLTNAFVQYTIDTYNVQPEVLTVPGSEARVAALLEGQLDASPVDLAGLEVLEREAPGQFHPLIVYAEELPGLIVTNHWVATREALTSKREAYLKLVEYQIEYHRKALEDPAWVQEQAARIVPELEPEQARVIAESYSQYGAFTDDGGINEDKMAELFQFYVRYGGLQDGQVPPIDEFVTTEFVNAAAGN